MSKHPVANFAYQNRTQEKSMFHPEEAGKVLLFFPHSNDYKVLDW